MSCSSHHAFFLIIFLSSGHALSFSLFELLILLFLILLITLLSPYVLFISVLPFLLPSLCFFLFLFFPHLRADHSGCTGLGRKARKIIKFWRFRFCKKSLNPREIKLSCFCLRLGTINFIQLHTSGGSTLVTVFISKGSLRPRKIT